MTLKIGINALPLTQNLTGIGRYTLEIIKQLAQLPDIELYLYTCHPLIVELGPTSNIHVIFTPTWLPKKLWEQWTLGKLIQKNSLDVFWSPKHHLPFNTGKIPLVLTIHDLVYRKYPHTMPWLQFLSEKLLLRYSVNKAKKIISVSTATRNDLIHELKIPAEKITIIHSGFFKPQAHQSTNLEALGIDKPFLLFLGTLEPRKNIARLIEAVLALPPELKNNYQLVLAGPLGWKNKKIKPQLANPQINYVGYVNDTTVHTLLKQATVFVFPSLYEGFGLPLLEAMSVGTPVLTSTDPACQEIAGDAAYFIDPYNVPSITQALQELLTNPDLRITLRNKGYENITRFSWEAAAKAHLKILGTF